MAYFLARLKPYEEKIKEWMSDLKSKFVPWLETEKAKLIAKLREKAADTTTPLDDAAVTVFDTVLTQIIEWLKTK